MKAINEAISTNLLQKIELEKPSFADEKLEILTPTEWDYARTFAISHYWVDCTSINIHDVVGVVDHGSLSVSWLELLKYGGDMQRRLRCLQDEPDYFFSTKKKEPPLSFIKIDSKTYICGVDHYTECIARFYLYYHDLTTLHGVTVNEYVTDNAFANAYRYIEDFFEREQLPVTLKLERETIKRNDTSGWMREFYDLRAIAKNHANGYEVKMTTDDMMTFIGESEKPFRSFINKYKELFRR